MQINFTSLLVLLNSTHVQITKKHNIYCWFMEWQCTL